LIPACHKNVKTARALSMGFFHAGPAMAFTDFLCRFVESKFILLTIGSYMMACVHGCNDSWCQ